MILKKTLSIIIPCFNEEKTIIEILKRIDKVKIKMNKKEIIVVDDFSTDNSLNLLKSNNKLYSKLIEHSKNSGKAAAVKTGINESTGDYIIIQDADLEYDPNYYVILLDKLIKSKCDAVYGTRFYHRKYNKGYMYGRMANKFFNKLFNKIYNSNLTDIGTCYKLFKSKVLKEIPLNENGFCIDTEISIYLIKNNKKIAEVPISYYPRSKKEGKKIGLKDVLAITSLLIKSRY